MIQQRSINNSSGAELGGADVTSATLSAGGAIIPLLGFGTYGMSGTNLQNVLVAALQEGFRHIDTVEASLRELRSEYIDLLLVHWPRGGAPLAEQVEGLNRAVSSGKVRHVGVSNYNAAMMRAANAHLEHPLVTNHPPHLAPAWD